MRRRFIAVSSKAFAQLQYRLGSNFMKASSTMQVRAPSGGGYLMVIVIYWVKVPYSVIKPVIDHRDPPWDAQASRLVDRTVLDVLAVRSSHNKSQRSWQPLSVAASPLSKIPKPQMRPLKQANASWRGKAMGTIKIKIGFIRVFVDLSSTFQQKGHSRSPL